MILSTTFPALVPLQSHAIQAGRTDLNQLVSANGTQSGQPLRVVFALTSGVLLHLPKRPQQFEVAFVASVVLRVEQDLLGIAEQARDAGQKEDTVR